MQANGKIQPAFSERDLSRWELIADFRERLERSQRPLPASFQDPLRNLTQSSYLSLFLFGLLNPVMRTMRGLCAGSHLARVQRDVCGQSVSLGSFSEAQHVLDLGLLQQTFGDLTQDLSRREGSTTQLRRWLIQDSTLWEALPRMSWARWRTQGKLQNAVRLHLGFHLLEDQPLRVKITPGKHCERKAWKQQWQPGDVYIGDRYYGENYQLFGQLEEAGCGYVLRLREEAIINVEEELAVSPAAAQAGVLRQAWVRLGGSAKYHSKRVRVVWVQTPKEVLLLVTNYTPEELAAEVVSLMYKQRWQIELFFRWIKCILGCRHWLAESPQGVAIQIYLALIAAVLLQLYTGQRPTRRMMELIQFYLMGVATLDELTAGIQKEQAKLAARKKS